MASDLETSHTFVPVYERYSGVCSPGGTRSQEHAEAWMDAVLPSKLLAGRLAAHGLSFSAQLEGA